MTKTATKPLYEFTPSGGPATRTIEDVDGSRQVISLVREGPANYLGLRNANYGSVEGGVQFRQAPLGLLTVFAHSALENDDESEGGVVEAMRTYRIAGRTLVLRTKGGLFVHDNPEIRDGRVHLDEHEFRDLIGAENIRNARVGDVLVPDTSNDLSVRYTPQGFEQGVNISAERLAKHPAIIALVGSEDRAGLFAEIAKRQHIKNQYIGKGLGKADQPRIAFPGFVSSGHGGLILAIDSGVLNGGGYSFGVLENGEAAC